jgi:hypothetical protein
MHAASPPPPDTTLLWERLRALFARVVAAIGAPAIIAALTLAPRMGTEIVRQLALVEILARKLLLADAVALVPAPAQRGPRLVVTPLRASGLYTLNQTRRRTDMRARANAIDPANPETWSARFALALPRDPRVVQERRAPRIRTFWGDAPAPPPAPETAPRPRQAEAFRIARRAEALRRVLNDPAPYARRLSLARGLGVARSREIITRYALRAPRRFVGDERDPRLTIDIFSVAVRAHAVLADTS